MESGRSHYAEAISSSLSGDVPSLEYAIDEVHKALDLFLNNEFELAEHRLALYANNSIYHAMGYSMLMFIKAVMTCDQKNISVGLETMRRACAVIEKMRSRTTIQSAIYSSFSSIIPIQTDEEVHAELCLAEVYFFRAILTFLADDNLSSCVIGVLKIRTCYQTYKKCHRLLHDVSFWRSPTSMSETLRLQFESGARMGVGAFNLMLSTLPARVLRFLEVVGFSGNKAVGFRELDDASKLVNTLRAPMASLALLSWHLFASYFFGNGDPHLVDCRKLLRPLATRHPRGAIALFFRARIALVSGDFASAIHFYRRSVSSQNIYRQFHHACFWELMFCHWCCRQWARAANYAKRLLDESKWSACVYTYALATLIDADETVTHRHDTVALLLRRVPSLRLRIAGKSIPIEKFCEQKARRHARHGHLYWPHYELFYFCSGFALLESAPHNFPPILEDLDDYWRRYPSEDMDDYCLYRFLRGVCLRALNRTVEAEECLASVICRDKHLVDFVYLAPNAYFELALLYAANDATIARQMLAKIRAYRGYPLETKLHFRAHHLAEKLTR